MSESNLEDRAAIHDLFTRYCCALDNGEIEAVVDCFTVDAILKSPLIDISGRDEIRAFAGRFAAQPVAQPGLTSRWRVHPPERVSRPAGFHRQPLVEPCVNFSAHTAPIRQTCRSCRSASERRGSSCPVQVVAENDWRGFCVP